MDTQFVFFVKKMNIKRSVEEEISVSFPSEPKLPCHTGDKNRFLKREHRKMTFFLKVGFTSYRDSDLDF